MIIEHLRNEFAARRRKNPSYSLRAFARSLGVNAGALSQIMSGKRALTTRSTRLLINSLSIDFVEKQKILGQWLGSEENTEFTDVSKLSEEIVGDWRYFAIHSALQTKNNRPEQLAKRLGLQKTEVLALIRILVKLGIVIEKAGKLEVAQPNITTTHDIPSTVIRNANRQWIEKSIDALENQAVDKRDVTGVTMAIDPKRIAGAKKLIKDFRRKLCLYLEGGSKEKVYRLNLQLFSIEGEE